MASTNKTPNYDLSQFLGSDKPAWLSDYNQDMSKIDTAVKTVADSATGADGKADANTAAIGTLSNLNTDTQANLVAAVNEVNSKAGTAQTTANNAATTGSQAKTKADALENYLKLSETASLTFTTNKGVIDSTAHLNVRRNSSGSLGKIYGNIFIRNLEGQTGELIITTSDTGFRPTQAITFDGCAYMRVESTSYHIFRTIPVQYTLNTDGTITFSYPNMNDIYAANVMFPAVLLFIVDFGDTIIPE